MLIAGLWGTTFPQPILSFLWESLTEPAKDISQWSIRILGMGFIIGGGILFYHIQTLPNDTKAKRIGCDAQLIKNTIIEITQLYKSLIDEAMTHTTADYYPLIKDDVVVKKEIQLHKDKGTAICSFLAYNPTNPLFEKIKKDCPQWEKLNDTIDRAEMDISDKKLNAYLRIYLNGLQENGKYKVNSHAILSDNPATKYEYRQIVKLNQDFSDINIRQARIGLINYLDDLIMEYSEQEQTSKKAVTR